MNVAELIAALQLISEPQNVKVMCDGESLLRVVPRFEAGVCDLVTFGQDQLEKQSEAIIAKSQH